MSINKTKFFFLKNPSKTLEQIPKYGYIFLKFFDKFFEIFFENYFENFLWKVIVYPNLFTLILIITQEMEICQGKDPPIVYAKTPTPTPITTPYLNLNPHPNTLPQPQPHPNTLSQPQSHV